MSTIVQGHVQTPAVDIRGSWTGTPEAPSIWKGPACWVGAMPSG